MIQGKWVITARHVVDKSDGSLANPNDITVRLEQYGGNYDVANIYAPSGGADIALLELTTTPSGALQIPLNDLFDEKDKLIEIGGYGRYGPAGNQQGTQSFHRAQNIVSSVTTNDLILYFTDPSHANAIDREGIGAPGDSGGTVLLNDGDGQWYLGGVHRAGSTTDPENDYGKKGWESRVARHKSWIDSHLDPLWRSEIEAIPADLNLDGLVDYNDIRTLQNADGTTVPFTLNKLDLVDDDLIVATHNVSNSDLDAYIIDGIGTQFGDSNLDKRVSLVDYNQLLAGFTGQNANSANWVSGDTDFDRDVDGDDYFTLVGNFGFDNSGGTGRNIIANEEDQLTPTLVYDPLSGHVRLRGEGLSLDAFQIVTVDEEDFFAQELILPFDESLQDVSGNGVFQLDLSENPLNTEELHLGSILPVGLDLMGLQAILATTQYSAGPSIAGEFALTFTSGIAGDFNNDGTVDAADFTAWRDNIGAPSGTLYNDIDGGQIGMDQYLTFVNFYGTTSNSAFSTAIPEPTALLLISIGSLSMLGRYRRSSV